MWFFTEPEHVLTLYGRNFDLVWLRLGLDWLAVVRIVVLPALICLCLACLSCLTDVIYLVFWCTLVLFRCTTYIHTHNM